MSKLSVPPTALMTFLKGDKIILRHISTSYESIEKVLFQIQRDVTNETNRDMVGPTILALKQCADIFKLIALEGDAMIKAEEALQQEK